MRGMTPTLQTPYPLGSLLPPALQEDQLAMRLTEALDAVLAPVIATLDCLYCYFDPQLAPTDFLRWLADEWVGALLDEGWPIELQREVVAQAAQLHRLRGTIAGLTRELEYATSGEVEVFDSGGATWSSHPVDEPQDEPAPQLTVRIVAPAGTTVSAAVVDGIVRRAKPAHVAHRVEVVGSPPRPSLSS